jgi:hypothetical protein
VARLGTWSLTSTRGLSPLSRLPLLLGLACFFSTHLPLFLTKPFLHFTPGAEHTALIAGKTAARPQPRNRAPSVLALAKRERLAADRLVLSGSADQRERVVARAELAQRRQPQTQAPVGDLCHSRREHSAVTRKRRMLGCAVVVVELRVCSRRTRSICLGRPIYKMITGDTSARTDRTVQCCFVRWDPAANDGRSFAFRGDFAAFAAASSVVLEVVFEFGCGGCSCSTAISSSSCLPPIPTLGSTLP